MPTLEKVVLIDDDPISNFIARKSIEKMDLSNRIRSITDPKVALAFLEERCVQKSDGICPELILLDFQFPTTTAIEILEELNCKGLEIGKDIVLVILSASDIKPNDREKLINLKVSDFIVKPLTYTKLEMIVKKYL
jgi:response regulator of citrate/malate metabolism